MIWTVHDYVWWAKTSVLYAISFFLGLFFPKKVEPPITEIPPFIRIYLNLHGFTERKRKFREKRIREFETLYQPELREIVWNSRHYGVHAEETPFGDGLFNGPGEIPGGTTFALYQADSFTLEAHQNVDGTNAVRFNGCFGEECILDVHGSETLPKPVRGRLINHACSPKANCEFVWIFEYGVWCLTVRTKPGMVVLPFQQLLLDYNMGGGARRIRGYWVPIEDLHDVPRRLVVLCGCGGWSTCHMGRGFDKSKIHHGVKG